MGLKAEERRQILAGCCVNIISLSYGAFCGWPSASFMELQSPESQLRTGPMSVDEVGDVGAMMCLGGIIGTVVFGYCAEKIGKKGSLLWFVGPLMMIAWMIIPFAQTPVHLAISRFIGGVAGGAVFTLVPSFTTELSSDSVRGLLGTFLILACNMGILSAFLLGYYCNYITVAWVLSLLSPIFMLCFLFIPETPQHLLKKDQMKDAEMSLRYYRNVRISAMELPPLLQTELEKLVLNEKTRAEIPNNSISWKDYNTRTVRRAFAIGIGLMALNQMSGLFAMLNYTATIFQQAGSNLSPKMSAIIVGAIQLIGSYTTSVLVERAGRKSLLMTSAFGTCIGLLLLGGYMYVANLGYNTSGFTWVPVASFSFSIFVGSLGVLNLAFVIVAEIMPPHIRSTGCMVCMFAMWIFCYFMLKYLPVLTAALGLHTLMFTFAGSCLIGALFAIFFVPETKGKSIEEILASL